MAFLKYGVQTLIVRMSMMLLGLVTAVINARWLLAEGLGIMALIVMLHTLAFKFGNLGFGSAFSFFLARKEMSVNGVLRQGWVIGLSMSVVMVLFFLVFWRHALSPWHDLDPKVFYLGLLTVPIYLQIYFSRRILEGQFRITVINISEIINGIASVSQIFLYVVVLKMGVIGAVFAMLITQFLVLVFLTIKLLRGYNRLENVENAAVANKTRTIDLWRYGRWNYFMMLTNGLLDDLPLFFIKHFGSNDTVGFFSTARNLSRKPRLVFEPFSSVLFPFTASSNSEDAVWRTNTLCRNVLVGMVVAVVFLGLLAKTLIVILFTEAFLPAVIIFYALMPMIVFYPLSHILAIHISARGNPKIMFLTSFAALVILLVLCYVLVPILGSVGAAISISCMYIILTVVRLVMYTRDTGSKLSEVLVLKKSDLYLYKQIFKRAISWIRRKKRAIRIKG